MLLFEQAGSKEEKQNDKTSILSITCKNIDPGHMANGLVHTVQNAHYEFAV